MTFRATLGEPGHMMRLYRTPYGAALEQDDETVLIADFDWNGLFHAADPAAMVAGLAGSGRRVGVAEELKALAPIVSQEVWAAGVTYYRSRDARMEESKAGGGEDFYARVYEAERPELFMKATP